MGKPAKPPAAAGGPPRSASWLTSRQRKKCWRLSVFVLLPITLAFLVAFLAAPEPTPLSSAGATAPAAQAHCTLACRPHSPLRHSATLIARAAGPSDAAVAAAAAEEEEERLPAGQAPPVDLWATPSECLAWAGDGQCKANEVRCPPTFAPPRPFAPLSRLPLTPLPHPSPSASHPHPCACPTLA